MVWYALESAGKIGMLDPSTGKMVEYNEPVKWAFPYDIQEDHDYNLWIADSGQGGALVKFEPRSKKFHLLSLRAEKPICQRSKSRVRIRSGTPREPRIQKTRRWACCTPTSRKLKHWPPATNLVASIVWVKGFRILSLCDTADFGRFCSARLQAGTVDSSTC